MMRLLTLATYPSSSPRHGGQLRVNAIHRTLRKAGWETSEFAICPLGAYSQAGHEDGVLAMSAEFAAELDRAGLRTDVESSRFVLENESASRALDHKISTFSPDVIAIEQAWLWPALQDHFARYGSRDRYTVVYSSHNIEEKLVKEELSISKTLGDGSGQLKSVQDIEQSLARSADGIVTVSATDAAFFEGSNGNVLLAANGTWASGVPGGLEYWRERLRGYRIALFVGSYHLPNGSGFCKCALKNSLAYLAPDEKIVIAGRVTELIRTMPAFRRHAGVNLARILEAGLQDEGGLASLFEVADVVVLPITEGGGTNIKTAEALLCNKRVVATKTAMRGYDAFLGLSGLTVVNDERDFPEALKASLAAQAPLKRSVAEKRLLSSLLWSHTLKLLPNFFEKLVERRNNRRSAACAKTSGRELSLLIKDGWYPPEIEGAWSSIRSATLELPLRAGVYTCQVTFTGFPPTHGKQIITFLNGTEVLNCTVVDNFNKSHHAKFLLSISPNKPVQVLEIEVQSSTLVSPAELGHSADTRPLAVRIKKIVVSPSEE